MKIGDYVRSRRSYGAICGFVRDFFKHEVLIRPTDGGEEDWHPIEEFYVDNQHKQTYQDWWDFCMNEQDLDYYSGDHFIGKEELNDVLTDQVIFLAESIEEMKIESFNDKKDYFEVIAKLNEQLNETVNSLILAQNL